MHDLEIRWPAGEARFSAADSPVLVGRSPEAAVILTDPSVSRRHLEFVWSGSAWTAIDSSTHGSFDPIGVRLRPEWRVGTDTVIRLGGPEGIEVQIFLVTTRPGQASGPATGARSDATQRLQPGLADVPPSPVRSPRPPVASQPPPTPVSSLFGSPPSPHAQPAPAPIAGTPLLPAAQAPAAQAPVPPAPLAEAGSAADAWPAWSGEHVVAPPTPSGTAGGVLASPSWSGDQFAPDRLAALPDDDGFWASPAATGIQPGAAPTVVNDQVLQLSLDGRDYTFLPGTPITVGRDPSSLVRVDERHALVSRRHLTITHHDGSWWIEDTSTKGAFIDGRRLTAPLRAQGTFMANLGHDNAGLPMRIIAAGEHRSRRQSNLPLVVVITVLTLRAIAALVIAVTNRGNAAAGLPHPAPAHQTVTGRS